MPPPVGAVDPAPPALARAAVVDRVAAVVNDDIILRSEIYELGSTYIEENVHNGEPRARLEADVLDRLIERALVDQEVARLHLAPSDADLDRAIDDTAQRNGLDRDGLKAELARQGLAWDDYRNEMRASLKDYRFAQVVLRPRITITDDELRDLWLRSGHAGEQEATVEALALALPASADAATIAAVHTKAAEVVAKSKAGTPWKDLADQYDEAKFKEKGGEMGTFRKGELVGPLDGAAFGAAVGEPVVIDMAGAVFVVRVAARHTATSGFEEARAQLENQIFQDRMEDEKERWYQQARRDAAIRVLLPGAS